LNPSQRSSLLDATVREFLDAAAAPAPAVTGGGVAAVTAAAAAGLVAMAARLSTTLDGAGTLAERAETLREHATSLAQADAEAYAAVLAAGNGSARQTALRAAAEPPRELAELARELAALAERLACHGKPALRGDAYAAAALATAAARSADELARINLQAAKEETICTPS
jgi:formiminotetrahydrofolate cyclodeaminase